ncbi:MAG TPA: DUF4236 domain-containing protein [Candidatus Limnocylindrales bacterium]|nr:DUF4236 domain-containing protein [Candidatus Limnocylindrales bacterium]
MGFRFQRRIKLFPGVRLNFSAGGISTTVGIRGAGVTFGKRGVHMNVGIPGTGLSYRTQIGTPPARRTSPTRPYEPSGSARSVEPPTGGEIRSAEVSALTTRGLGELKSLVNEAAIRRAELTREAAQRNYDVKVARRRLRCARWFIVRIFTQSSIPRHIETLEISEALLEEVEGQLEGCSVEIDFAFDEPTLAAYRTLIHAFDALASCQRIWDITASVGTDRVADRTIASHSLARILVSLRKARSEILDTQYDALVFANSNGSDIYIYPGFVLIPGTNGDFALIELSEFTAESRTSRFIEEEQVPRDTEVVGYTWKKANKDGSRDKRFAGNYQIPIARYGEIHLTTSTGLHEVFQFSNHAVAAAFHEQLNTYKQALAKLAERSNDRSGVPLLSVDDNLTGAPEPPVAEPTTSTVEGRDVHPPRLILDWIALALGIAAIVFAGTRARHWNAPSSVAKTVPALASFAKTSATTSDLPRSPDPAAADKAASPPKALPPLPSSSSAESKLEKVYVQRPVVNIRTEPTTESRIVGTLKQGRKVTVFERRGTWAKIGDSSPLGWVHRSLVGASAPK